LRAKFRNGRVQSQSARAEPGLDIIEKTVNCSRRIIDWRADVDLTVIRILM